MTKAMSVALLSAALLLPAQKPEAAESLLQAATKKEVVDGDLAGAIEGYKKTLAAAKENRAIAARALYQLGECYRKQGNAQARQTFERLIKEYGDQAVAAQARVQLAAMGAPASGEVRARLLWDDAPRGWPGISGDGRWMSFADQEYLALRNLAGGERRRLKKGILGHEGLDTSIVSPDGRQVAFFWWQWEAKEGAKAGYSFRIMRADGAGERVLFDIGMEPKRYWLEPQSWSPDGKWIAALEYRTGVASLLLVSAESGQVRVLVTRPWPSAPISFSPDGRWLTFVARSPSSPTASSVYTVPAAGAESTPREIAANAKVVGWTPDGQGILFTRNRNDTPEMYLLPVSEGKAAGEPRKLSAVPEFRDRSMTVTPGGSLVYQKRRRTTDSLVAEVDLDRASLGKTVLTRPTEAIGAANGMGGGVRFSPDGKRVLFTLPQKQLLIRSLADGSEHTILPQMLGLGRIEWAADGASLLGVGMGKDGKCGFYRVDPASGATALLAACDGENGWFANSAPSPDGKSVYYVVAAGLAAVDLATGTVRSVSTKPVFGFQEMRFSHDGRKLALFQEGGVDILELGAGEVRELIRTAGSYWGGDWSPDDRFLLTTVGYRDSPTELVKLSMDGGAPVKTQLPAHYRGVRLSPDGKTLAMTRWDERRQIWSLENFLPAQSARRE